MKKIWKASRFSSMDEASMYMMYGDGMYTFTQSYLRDHSDRLVELRVKEAGSLILYLFRKKTTHRCRLSWIVRSSLWDSGYRMGP